MWLCPVRATAMGERADFGDLREQRRFCLAAEAPIPPATQEILSVTHKPYKKWFCSSSIPCSDGSQKLTKQPKARLHFFPSRQHSSSPSPFPFRVAFILFCTCCGAGNASQVSLHRRGRRLCWKWKTSQCFSLN